MNTRVLIRWIVSIVIAIGVIGTIGLALNPAAQARATVTYDWPGLLPPCNTPSLQQCIDGALVLPGDTIHIKPGVYTQSITLARAVSLVGDNPQTTILNAEPFQRVLTVTGNMSSSTIISGLTFAHGNLTAAACPDACGGGMLISGTARPVLQNITLAQNSASQGGGLWIDAGPVVRLINVASISNTVNGLTAYGGGAFASGFVSLEGGRFVGNNGVGEVPAGGGLYAMGASVSGTQFLGNTLGGSSSYGGGMYLSSGPSELLGVTLIGNQSAWGGAIYAGGTLSLTDGVVLNNTALNYGGGVYGNFGNLAVTRGKYEGNVANFGGAFYASGPLTLLAARVAHNTATDGGGVYAVQPVVIEHSNFLDNQAAVAAGRGGALYVANALDLNSTLLISNSAAYGGGVYHDLTGDVHIVNTVFARNQARNGPGAALNLNSAGNVIILHTTIGDPAGNPGHAIESTGGTLGITDTIIVNHATAISVTNANAYENYNLFFGNGVDRAGAIAGGGNDLIGVDPQFVDPLNDDYHLRFSSPAIDNGVNAGVAFDFDGQPRPIGPGFDIGFDESGTSIQQLIDATPPGGTVFIPGGAYTESLTLYKPVSLIGQSGTPPTIHAVTGQRVLTITGPAITNSTVISGLVLTGADIIDTGGGILITNNALPTLRAMQVRDNFAEMGGGLYIDTGGVQLLDSNVTHNQARQSGGGVYVAQAGASFEQRGGTIDDNRAVDGAGVFVQNGAYHPVGTLIISNTASRWGGGLLIGSGGDITLDNAQIQHNVAISGGGLFIDLGQAELLSGSIFSNTAQQGGGVYVKELTATFTLTNGIVSDNLAHDAGGGVYVLNGQVQLNGGVKNNRAVNGAGVFVAGGRVNVNPFASITDNIAEVWGGGVYVDQPGADLIQSGGLIGLNHAQDGGGVRIADGSYTLLDGQVYGNSAVGYGGGVLVDRAPALMTQQGGTIENNSAQRGGGLYVISGAVSFGGPSSIFGNTAGSSGGGVYLQDGNFNMHSGTILSNTANNGGGVYIESPRATLTQSLGLIGGNHAQLGSGGGFFVENGYALLVDGQIISNTADNNGGGAYVMGGKFKVSGPIQFTNNAATGQATTGKGGGLNAQAGFVQLNGGRFVNNVAGTDGGGVYAATELMITGTRFFRNTANNDGGAIYHTGSGNGRVVNVFVAGNSPTAANVSGASLSFNSTGYVYLLHGTLANSTTAVGRAIGVNAGVVNVYNTIVASYTTGISRTSGAAAEDYNLYFGNTFTSTGAITHGVHDLIGLDPQFVNPVLDNYHVRGTSPAVNLGSNVGVRRDIDFDARPLGGAFDIGADEAAVSAANILPNLGGTMTYTSPQGTIIQVNVPPGAVTTTLPIYCSLINSSTISLPPRLMLSGNIFELDGYPDPDATNFPPPIFFNAPVTLTVTYTDADVVGINEAQLKLYRFEPNSVGWQPIGYRPGETQTIDIDNNVITATILGFSKFGRMGPESGYELFLPIVLRN